MTERDIINDLLISLPDNERLFRSNSGMGWQGESVWHDKKLIIRNARPFHGLPEGFPDLCGWKSVTITPDMVGQTVAIFQGVEIKTGRLKLTEMQKKFRDVIIKMGGIFREVRG